MKTILTRFFVIFIYITILLYAFHFRIARLWDARGFFLVAAGTLLLSSSVWKRRMERRQFLQACSDHSMPAAYLTTFVELFARFSSQPFTPDEVVPIIALCCRPLLYGYLIQLIFEPAAFKAVSLPETTDADSAACSPDPKEQAHGSLTPEQALRRAGLTPRETEITLLVREGLSNKEIAARLFISDTTVKKHISNIFDKLGLTNREQLKHIL